MTKEEFENVLQRYKTGDCTPEEIEKINQWFNKISDDSLELNEWEREKVRARVLSKLQHALPADDRKHDARQSVFTILKIAASFLVLVLVGYSIFNRSLNNSSSKTSNEL